MDRLCAGRALSSSLSASWTAGTLQWHCYQARGAAGEGPEEGRQSQQCCSEVVSAASSQQQLTGWEAPWGPHLELQPPPRLHPKCCGICDARQAGREILKLHT